MEVVWEAEQYFIVLVPLLEVFQAGPTQHSNSHYLERMYLSEKIKKIAAFHTAFREIKVIFLKFQVQVLLVSIEGHFVTEL